MVRTFFLVLLLSACPRKEDTGAPTGEDADGDGFTVQDGDCDDRSASIHPGAEERCNDQDDDCDGTVDGPLATDATHWYQDGDGDGWGDPATATDGCTPASGQVADGTDCDDADPSIHPGAEERCDGADQDCDGLIDEESPETTRVWTDGDGDGWGDPATEVEVEGCGPPEGTAVQGEDCDDGDATVNPDATERCDGRDQDCDGLVDEDAADARTWYPDADGDGYGDRSAPQVSCSPVKDAIEVGGDCDDGDPSVHPGSTEDLALLGDEDCDGLAEGNLSEASVFFEGPEPASQAGMSLASVGDVTGDGVPDLLVGAPDEDDYAFGPGNAFLVPGDPVGGLRTDPSHTLTLEGAREYSYAGYKVAGGDLTGDGWPDLVVGAPYMSLMSSYSGAVYVVFGPVTGDTLLAEADVSARGHSDDTIGTMMLAEDLDGDGIDDLVVGESNDDKSGNNAGSTHVFLGPMTRGDTPSTGDADVHLFGSELGGYLGASGAAADWDLDGYVDLALGAHGVDSVYLFLGPLTAGAELEAAGAASLLTSATPGDGAGSLLSAAEGVDLTGDGRPDLVVGEESACGGDASGALYVVEEPLLTGTLSADGGARICGEAADRLASGDLAVGDWDGDGVGDLLVGSPLAHKASLHKGPVLGERTQDDATFLLHGESTHGEAGQSVALVDDMDGDGVMEVVVGDNAGGEEGRGRAWLTWGGWLLP